MVDQAGRQPLSVQKAEKRLHRRDQRLPLHELFDPDITTQLWESLPPECRRLSFSSAEIPERYRGAIVAQKSGPPSKSGNQSYSQALNFTGLPEPMSRELAWLVFREVELGRNVSARQMQGLVRHLRAATSEGTTRGREAESLLSLTVEDWYREVHAARLRGIQVSRSDESNAQHLLHRLQDTIVHAYHQGEWWQLDLWNPVLDPRIPRREHEPWGRSVANFTHLQSAWLREAAKWWLSTALETESLVWSSVKTRLDQLKWLQRFIDQQGDVGPQLVSDSDELRDYCRRFAAAMREHLVLNGRTVGKPLSPNVRRSTMVALEAFYRHMYTNRIEAARVLNEPRWLDLGPEHSVLFLPGEKPRLTNKAPEDQVLEPTVVSAIAEGSELLAKPKSEGGFGDLQAFHALALLVRTGRRMNEILMMDFDPLLPLIGSPGENAARDDGALVARMRYQLTKIESSGASATIPVDDEIVSIIRAQQAVARNMLREQGTTADPKYLFLRTRVNRNGLLPYSAATLHGRLTELAERLDLRDGLGGVVHISRTHQFRHTKATSLLNAGVPLHVVQRYFGHITPTMTMHYAKTLSETAEREFLRYRKVTADGRPIEMDPSDLFDVLHLDKRADRVLPNGWCMLPPRQVCNKGNACLSCSAFATDESHRGELEDQLLQTDALIDSRMETFEKRNGCPMPDDNVWLAGRRGETRAIRQVLIALDEVKARPTAVQGAGTADRAAGDAS